MVFGQTDFFIPFQHISWLFGPAHLRTRIEGLRTCHSICQSVWNLTARLFVSMLPLIPLNFCSLVTLALLLALLPAFAR